MKKLSLSFLSAAALAVIVAACAGTSKKELTFKTVNQEASYKLDVPEDLLHGTWKAVYSTNKADLQIPTDIPAELDEALRKAAFPYDSISTDIDTAVKKFIETPADYMQTSVQKVDKVPATTDSILLLTQNVKIDTLNKTDKLITFCVHNEGYLGGAHGYFSKAYVNYDLANSKVVKADTILTDTNAVRDLILKQLAANNNTVVDSLESKAVVFSVADVKVPANFYFDNDSVVFYYNPYEISSWAQGEIKVAIPTASLQQYFSDYGKKLTEKQ